MRTCSIVDCTVPTNHRGKIKESETLNFAEQLKKAMENESDGDTNCHWRTWTGPQRLEISRRINTIQIAETDQNTEKSP